MSTVIMNKEGAIGYVILNRVDRHNSLVTEFLVDIRKAINTFSDDSEVKAIILKANGKTFSTGGDVASFYKNRDHIKEYSESIVGSLNVLIMTMIDCPKPIIAAVHGMVTGGSMGLVLASDIVLVSPKTTFTPYYSTVGYSPDGGWAVLLKEIIGAKRTAEIIMTDATITAEQSVNWGIASKIVELTSIDDEANRIATRIASLKMGSISRTKKLLWNRESVLTGLDMELRSFIDQISTDEGMQGMKDFLDSLVR